MIDRISTSSHAYHAFDAYPPQDPAAGTAGQPPARTSGTQNAPLKSIEFGHNPSSTPSQAPAQPSTPPSAHSLLDRFLLSLKADTPPAASVHDSPSQEKAQDYGFLDDSKHSSSKALKKWEALLGDLPPAEREAAAKELNRPIAAARIAAQGGPDAEKAWAFIRDNPALMTAVDVGKDGGKADGKITERDLKAFANHMEDKLGQAEKTLHKYEKEHPDADLSSKQLVRSAALLLANEPLTQAADPASAQGAEKQRKVNGCASAAGLASLQGNDGLADVLQNAATTWSKPGMFDLLDRGGANGKQLAKKGPDGQSSGKDIAKWIEDKAPSTSEDFSRTLSDAASIGAVANVDISQLNGDVFSQPNAYSGKQKAAVLIKLQQTREQVEAGGDIRDTRRTEEELAEKIGQLQGDPDVQAFLSSSLDEQAASIVNGDPRLAKVVENDARQAPTGLHPGGEPSPERVGPTDETKEALSVTADTVHRVVSFASNSFEREGSKAAVGLGGRIAAAVGGRVAGAIAGEAAGAAAASAIGAAAGPVGWAVSGLMSIGMGISEIVHAVKARKERKAFSRTVNPTLEQFEIAKPK
nr:type III effector HrpK domain-containing protein [uncultured Pseudomonas sp.]